MLSSALTFTAESLTGYWDGTANGYWHGASDFGWASSNGELARIDALAPEARLAVLTQEAMGLFKVVPVTSGPVKLQIADRPLLTLTPPDLAALESQMVHLRAAADLRADRMSEILAQQGDMLSFFGAQQKLGFSSKRWTMLLLHVLYAVVSTQEMRIKHFCSVPRPIDLSPQVQPVIQTPGHSSYPSGHATEGFAFATILVALRYAAEPNGGKAPFVTYLLNELAKATNTQGPEEMDSPNATILLFRLAARIADNRTVAGVHFPIDSLHGGLLGLQATLAFIAHCSGDTTPIPAYTVDGRGWTSDFTLAKWRDALYNSQPGNLVAAPVANAWDSLPVLWQAAVVEWKNP